MLSRRDVLKSSVSWSVLGATGVLAFSGRGFSMTESPAGLGIKLPMTFEEFEKNKALFQLGGLDTEQANPLTKGWSMVAKSDAIKSVAMNKTVDVKYLTALMAKAEQISAMSDAIKSTIENGGKVYMFGAGATGRLSISVGKFCQSGLIPEAYRDRFVGFMSGGDAALVRSIAEFEDFPDKGARQLREIGFNKGDLLIASTEGGETPIVIGATEEALKISDVKPYFLYCNPDNELTKLVERSKRVIENPAINKISIAGGPMSLAGSTRMQATTVLMASISYAILQAFGQGKVSHYIGELTRIYKELDTDFIAETMAFESDVYAKGGYITYEAQSYYAVTVLTDTTERSPTFSLVPFENRNTPDDKPSLCYLSIPNVDTSKAAWLEILGRDLKTLEWPETVSQTGIKNALGFDLSKTAVAYREAQGHKQVLISVNEESSGNIALAFPNKTYLLKSAGLDIATKNLLLKMVLNAHSTLVMALYGRFESNLMTYVRPSNGKLIDRCIRYVSILAKERCGKRVDYDTVARELFNLAPKLNQDDPIVLKLTDSFCSG